MMLTVVMTNAAARATALRPRWNVATSEWGHCGAVVGAGARRVVRLAASVRDAHGSVERRPSDSRPTATNDEHERVPGEEGGFGVHGQRAPTGSSVGGSAVGVTSVNSSRSSSSSAS